MSEQWICHPREWQSLFYLFPNNEYSKSKLSWWTGKYIDFWFYKSRKYNKIIYQICFLFEHLASLQWCMKFCGKFVINAISAVMFIEAKLKLQKKKKKAAWELKINLIKNKIYLKCKYIFIVLYKLIKLSWKFVHILEENGFCVCVCV